MIIDFLRKMLRDKPDAIVCANDFTAARAMAALTKMGIRVPEEMRIVGIDDVKYASLLPVPLTTQHQNCADIGATAMATMLQRLEKPDLPTRDILLQTHTVVRNSCGTHLARHCKTYLERHRNWFLWQRSASHDENGCTLLCSHDGAMRPLSFASSIRTHD